MEKSCRKCAPKASPRTHFYFDKQPKTARYFEGGLLKTFKKVKFTFSFKPSPF